MVPVETTEEKFLRCSSDMVAKCLKYAKLVGSNHHVRLRQCAMVFTYACTGCGAVRDQPSRLVSLLCVWGAARGITKKVKSLPQTNYLTQLRTREDSREVVDV